MADITPPCSVDQPTTPAATLDASDTAGSLPYGLGPGEQVGDFELLRLLGEGAFAKVFLARQLSLDRLVAVKLSANKGSEARTLASLEHDHIVHVYLEMILPERDLRLLCMQYVPGTTLHEIIAVLARPTSKGWDGRSILEIIDGRTLHPPAMDPAALRDRDYLDDCDAMEAVCWMGERLAEALAYAHRAGVLHRDVKPANILVNSYGRPMLADFNIAVDAQSADGNEIGGTPSYMAPEHLEALFAPGGHGNVDRRCDIYGLGVVLFELLTGQLPFPHGPAGPNLRAYVKQLAEQRRAGPPSVREVLSETPSPLDRTLRRCLEPDPGARFDEATDLAQSLVGCRVLREIEKELPPPWPFPAGALKHPFAYLLFLIVAPQALSSLVNIAYNGTQIVSELNLAQRAAFSRLVVGYNLLVYPICLAMIISAVLPVYTAWTALEGGEPVDPAQVDRARWLMLTWPTRVTIVSCIGWLPGAIVFPLGVHLWSDPVGPDVYWHFLISVTISGLIAVTYSYFAVQFIALRCIYPTFWADTRHVRRRIVAELGKRRTVSWIFKVLAGVIPLLGAILMVSGGPELVGMQAFRVLVTALILLGMLGFLASVFAGDMLAQTFAILMGNEPERRPHIRTGPSA